MNINDVARDFILESQGDIQELAGSAATLKARYERLAEENMVLEERNESLAAEIEELLIERESAEAKVNAATEMLAALESMLSIISESTGISGWHLNGDIAPWGEFQTVIDIESAIRKARGEE